MLYYAVVDEKIQFLRNVEVRMSLCETRHVHH